MEKATRFIFPVGYQNFHKKQLFNFQLNRWYSLGYLKYDDMNEAGQELTNITDWKLVMLEKAQKAITKEQIVEAAFFYRAAEFYTLAGDPDKELFYDHFIRFFYDAFADDKIEQIRVPYQDSFLSVIRVAPKVGNKGTILMHGGFDSFIEEFYSMMDYFSDHGFEVIAFDGPGQGASLKKYNLAFDYHWEKPVTTIINYLGLDDITLYGISMGGYLCLRAAAFESRIRRVISSGGAYDYSKIAPAIAMWLMKVFSKYFRKYTNKQAYRKISKGGSEAWQISNIMYITQKEKPMDAFDYAMKMNKNNLHPEEIKQDMMIMTGRNDHFIPFKLHDPMIKILHNAASIADKIYTIQQHASNHCQIGNIKLALDDMIRWINEKS